MILASLLAKAFDQLAISVNVEKYLSGPCAETRVIARARFHTCRIPTKSKRSPVPTSQSTMQSHKPNRNFFVAAAALVTVSFCFYSSHLACFVLNEAFDILQEKEALYFGYTILGSHVQFQMIKSNRSYKRGHMCKPTFLLQFLPGMDYLSTCPIFLAGFSLFNHILN